MERSIAIKKLGKLLGKKLGYRIDNKASTQAERDAAKDELAFAIAKSIELKDARDIRYKAILAADTEYQRLHAEHCTASEQVDRLRSIMRHRKITVGISESMFFMVKAEGDSWEEVIDKLEAKQDA